MLGSWAFLIGSVLALVIGVLSSLEVVDVTNIVVASILILLGVIVGLLNITEKETMPFLVSGLALIIASFFGASITVIVPLLGQMLMALLMVIVPATIIVALRNVFVLAKK